VNQKGPRAKLGRVIRHVRQEMDISQEELGFRCGLHRTYVGSVERGERNIALENLVRIATALERPVSALLKQAGL